MPAPVVHFEIGVKDIEKAKKFYGPLLGWEFQSHGNAAMLGNIGPMAPKPTEGIGGHLNSLGHPPHQYVTFYAQVDDLQKTLELATKLGGKTVVPPQEVPGMGHFAWFQDPEGNCVGLWKPAKKG
jgi:predicted enzyme related to lactoylglutathione lyase